jgi:2-polyprenyl-3-methyl-5-hydroxy-6-metoxy-1,4-benzoquinol methylase
MGGCHGKGEQMMQDTFSNIYAKQVWGKGLGSGTGSSPQYCAKWLELLGAHLRQDIIVLDLGCGDWQLYKDFDWKGASYLGADVVSSVIEENRKNHPEHEFAHVDFSDVGQLGILMAIRPELILIKDVLQHWSDEELVPWLDTFKAMLNYPCTVLTANNWKYHRTPEKNGGPRDVNNRYRWAPLDLTLHGFKEVAYYPNGKFKQVCMLKGPL